jgi:hypothetical protein
MCWYRIVSVASLFRASLFRAFLFRVFVESVTIGFLDGDALGCGPGTVWVPALEASVAVD